MKYHVRVPFENLSEVQNKDFLLGKKKLRPTVMVDLGVVTADDVREKIDQGMKGFAGLRKGKDTPRLVLRVTSKTDIAPVHDAVENVLKGGRVAGEPVLVTVVLEDPSLVTKSTMTAFDGVFSKHEGCVLALSQPGTLQGSKKLSTLCSTFPSLSVLTGTHGQVLTVGSVRSGLVGYSPEGVEVLASGHQEGGITLDYNDDQLVLVNSEVKVKAVKPGRTRAAKGATGTGTAPMKKKAATRKIKAKGIMITTVSR